MLNLLRTNIARFLLSNIAIVSGILSIPSTSAEAAVFKLTLDGLEGSGTIGFHDNSITGYDQENVKVSDLIDGYFEWNFIKNEVQKTVYDPIQDKSEITKVNVELDSAGDFTNIYEEPFQEASEQAFQEASLIFENGELVGIDNYNLSLEIGGYIRSETVFTLDQNSGEIDYFNRSFRGNMLEETIQFNVSNLQQNFSTIVPLENPNPPVEPEIEVSVFNLQQNFSTIVPLENPNPPVEPEQVPEPNILLGLSVLGLGFLLKKKSSPKTIG
ncbi:MAG: PEP-CTERM sorting domain-containing protein [Microcoleaceae cyanobacterium MO_207.B10]|nr:PEP-CTERM sorting domain-containing protein [Microcoleaceae cyanobacterium MO_207.B10]